MTIWLFGEKKTTVFYAQCDPYLTPYIEYNSCKSSKKCNFWKKKKQTGGNLYKCGVGNDFLDGIKVMSHKQKNYKLTLSKFKSSKDTVKKIQRQATDREQAFSK